MRKTALTRSLGMLYQAPVDDSAGWSDHECAANDPHAGILTQLSFLALHSHPGKSSPTVRGKALRLSVFTLFTGQPDLDWLKLTTQRWADEILRLNRWARTPPCPPSTSSPKSTRSS